MTIVNLNLARDSRKKVAVISHERSGTHFLMNTIALNFGYIADPWWNFDFDLGINFHASHGLVNYLKQAHDRPVLNILKSHHTLSFFMDFIGYFQEQFHVFYVVRDPRDALISNWKLINTLQWDEGPKTPSISDFIRSEPRGAMMRYQKKQEKNMVTRWATHVREWLDFAKTNQGQGITVIKYEDLNQDFENTLSMIAGKLNIFASSFNRPDRYTNVINPGPGQSYAGLPSFSHRDNEFVIAQAKETMDLLHYVS